MARASAIRWRVKAKWAGLLRQYCGLDTLSMVLILEHWRRLVGLCEKVVASHGTGASLIPNLGYCRRARLPEGASAKGRDCTEDDCQRARLPKGATARGRDCQRARLPEGATARGRDSQGRDCQRARLPDGATARGRDCQQRDCQTARGTQGRIEISQIWNERPSGDTLPPAIRAAAARDGILAVRLRIQSRLTSPSVTRHRHRTAERVNAADQPFHTAAINHAAVQLRHARLPNAKDGAIVC